MRYRILVLLAGIACLAPVAEALPYAAWSTCILTANNYCPLDPGTYQVGSTLYPAPGVTISGLGVSPSSTTLQRWFVGTTGADPIIWSLSGVLQMSNLQIDGNRWIFPNYWYINSNTGTYYGPASGYGCTPGNFPAVDVQVEGMGYINNVSFLYAPGDALHLKNGYVNNTVVSTPRSTGVKLSAAASVWSSYFNFAGTAAINILGGSGGGSYAWGNTLYMNRFEISDWMGGGQLYLDPGASYSIIAENSINGGNWITSAGGMANGCYLPNNQAPFGIEIDTAADRLAYNNHFLNNDIQQNPGGGMSIWGSDNTQIYGYNSLCTGCALKDIHDNNNRGTPGLAGPGIEIKAGHFPNTNVLIEGVRSRSNSGYAVNIVDPGVTGQGYTPGDISGHGWCLSSTTYTPPYNVPGPAGLTYPTPGPSWMINRSVDCPNGY